MRFFAPLARHTLLLCAVAFAGCAQGGVGSEDLTPVTSHDSDGAPQSDRDADTTSSGSSGTSGSGVDIDASAEDVNAPETSVPPDASVSDTSPPPDDGAVPPDAQNDGGPAPDSSTGCATVPPSNTCGLSPQCGCGGNQTCDVVNDTTGDTRCIEAGGGLLGGSCSSTADCSVGSTCVFGACRPYCSSAGGPCDDPGTGVCYDPDGPTGNPTPNRHVCSIDCDLRNPSFDCPGNSCAYFGSAITDCRPAGVGVQDADCTGSNDCDIGLDCELDESGLDLGPICMQWCRLSHGDGDCSIFTTCTDILGPDGPIQNGEALGLCD